MQYFYAQNIVFTRKGIVLLLFAFWQTTLYSQSLNPNTKVDWSTCGYEGTISCGGTIRNAVVEFKIDNSGKTDVSAKINGALVSIKDNEVLYFPNGTYLLKTQVNIPSKRILRGQSPTNTVFIYDSTKTNNSCFYLGGGEVANSISQVLTISAFGQDKLTVNEPTKFKVGDVIELYQANDNKLHSPLDANYLLPEWAQNLKGQMAKIKAISGNQITLDRTFTFDYDIKFAINIKKVNMVEEIGLENFKLIRASDNGLASSNNNFWLIYAKNCWFRKIHSEYTSRYHFRIESSRNIEISECFLDKSYNCGGGGAGYGILTQDHTTDCRFENNIARALRHPWIPKEGASKNVYAYNFSVGTTQGELCDSDPLTNSFADISVHGHYPAHNLFEGNIVYRITSSDAWGPNGPGNTFFRNRVIGKKGIWIKNYSKFQNVIGNELTYPNADFKLDLDNSVTGTILSFNNYGLAGLLDKIAPHTIENSLYLTGKPDFFKDMAWPSIGPGTNFNKGQIPAEVRFKTGKYFSLDPVCSLCKFPSLGSEQSLCGKSSIELKGFSTSNSNYTYTWFKNGQKITANTYNLIVKAEGEYLLRTDSLGCTNESFVNIKSTIPKPTLGDDFSLCSPSEKELSINFSDPTFLYKWYKDGNEISQNSTLLVTRPGKYIGIVSASGCTSASDTVNVNSRLINVKGDTVCLKGDFAKIEVINNGKFSWYSELNGGIAIENSKILNTQLPKVYVEKTDGQSFLVGMKKPDFTNNRSFSSTDFTNKLKFVVLAPLTLDSLSFWPERATLVEIRVLDADNITEIDQKVYSKISPGKENRVHFGVELKPGVYFLDFVGTNEGLYYSNEKDLNVKYPYTIDGLISITGGDPTWVSGKPWYMYGYNWRVTSGNICQRTPVEVHVLNMQDCPLSVEQDQLSSSFSIFPNPSVNGVFELSKETEWEVYSLEGVRIKEGNSKIIDLSNHSKGMYLFKSHHLTSLVIY